MREEFLQQHQRNRREGKQEKERKEEESWGCFSVEVAGVAPPEGSCYIAHLDPSERYISKLNRLIGACTVRATKQAATAPLGLRSKCCLLPSALGVHFLLTPSLSSPARQTSARASPANLHRVFTL